jgi:repressor of nif and glnA expression
VSSVVSRTDPCNCAKVNSVCGVIQDSLLRKTGVYITELILGRQIQRRQEDCTSADCPTLPDH